MTVCSLSTHFTYTFQTKKKTEDKSISTLTPDFSIYNLKGNNTTLFSLSCLYINALILYYKRQKKPIKSRSAVAAGVKTEDTRLKKTIKV